MKQYPILKYKTLRNSDDELIGPLKIPLIPPGVNPDEIWPLIIEEEKREDREQPYSPLRIPEKPEDPSKIC